MQDRSVVVKGYVNNDLAETFVFSFEFDEEQEKVFDPPLVLDASNPTTNIVLEVDMSIWFTDAQGNLLDPRVSENKSTIENNIKTPSISLKTMTTTANVTTITKAPTDIAATLCRVHSSRQARLRVSYCGDI